jgi:hypothetical protein
MERRHNNGITSCIRGFRMKDLVVLCADKDMEFALKGLLSRPRALGISEIDYDIFTHPEHDPGVALHGVEFLRPYAKQYRHALLIFDYEGCGRERYVPNELEKQIRNELRPTDWGDRADVVVIVPELESWVWSDSPHVDDVSGWKGKNPSLREWLVAKNWLTADQIKPERPKEAFEAALREAGQPKSASLYNRIASNVSLKSCTDDTFHVFVKLMRSWFQVT